MIFKTVDGVDIGYKLVNGLNVVPTDDEIKEFVQVAKDHLKLMDLLSPAEYQRERQQEYNNAGLTIEKLIVDLWEKEVEGRPDASIASQAIREQIKEKYPKPGV